MDICLLKEVLILESFCNSVSTLVKAQIGPNNGSKIKLGDKIKINTIK